jgi:hypothetical protein
MFAGKLSTDFREPSERVLGAIADQLGLSPAILIAEANPSPLGRRSYPGCAGDSVR